MSRSGGLGHEMLAPEGVERIDVEALREQLRGAVEGEIRAGVPVVGVEPSCVASFRDELPNLMPHDEDAKRLSLQTSPWPSTCSATRPAGSRRSWRAALIEMALRDGGRSHRPAAQPPARGTPEGPGGVVL